MSCYPLKLPTQLYTPTHMKWSIYLWALLREKESTVPNCTVPFTDKWLRFHCCWGQFTQFLPKHFFSKMPEKLKTFKVNWPELLNVWHLIYSLLCQSDCQMGQWAWSSDRVSFNSTNKEILKWNTNRFVGCKDKLMTLEDFSEDDAYCLFHFLCSALSKSRLCLRHEM